MKVTIEFPFHAYTKHDLMKFVYGENVNKVDSAIPQEIADEIRLTCGNNAPFWYVQDYTENSIFGKTTNLKEAFFNKLASDAIKSI